MLKKCVLLTGGLEVSFSIYSFLEIKHILYIIEIELLQS